MGLTDTQKPGNVVFPLIKMAIKNILLIKTIQNRPMPGEKEEFGEPHSDWQQPDLSLNLTQSSKLMRYSDQTKILNGLGGSFLFFWYSSSTRSKKLRWVPEPTGGAAMTMKRQERWRSTQISSPAANCCELPRLSGRQSLSFLFSLKICPFVPFLVANDDQPRPQLWQRQKRRDGGGWEDERNGRMKGGMQGYEGHGSLRGSAEKACPQKGKKTR